MKHICASQTKRFFFTNAFIAVLFIFPSLLHAEIYKVQLTSYSACGGATLVPFCTYTGSSATPVTIYYERLVAADSWQTEGTQVYNSSTSYIQYNGSDLTTATTFRVRALDVITGNIYISNSVSVDPAQWNIDRGTAFSTAYGVWGSNCGKSNFINIETNTLTNGRPPFTMQYKKTTESAYSGAGETTGYGQISNIEWGSNYDVRITDRCGKVVNLSTRLYLACSYGDILLPSSCNSLDGSVTIYPSTDNRYVGIPPYTYNVRKPGNSTTDTTFVSSNVFSNLSSGTYDYAIRDACGHTSAAGSVTIGNATPTGYANWHLNTADSCLIDIEITATGGTAPLQYGVSLNDTLHFTYSASSVLQVSKPGSYYYRVVDACGNHSRDTWTSVFWPIALIDSVRTINNGCFKDKVVYARGGVKPYQYVLTALNPYSVIKQSSDTFRNLAPNTYIFSLEDRCGKPVASAPWIYDTLACSLRTDTGSFQSQNNSVGCANISGNNWIDIADDKGNLVYSINPNGNVMNNVCWGVHVENNSGKSIRSDTMNGVPSYFLDRNFYIEPPANLVLTDSVSVRIYFTDAELQGMLGYLGDSLNLYYSGADLKILKKKGSPGSPVDLEVTNDTTASQSQFIILTPKLMPYGSNWYMEFKVKDFSEFNPYMGEFIVLPLQLISFGAKTVNKGVQLTWQTANEVNTNFFAVQWSEDGNSFTTIGVVKANGSAANSYSIVHNTPNNGNNYYRLLQADKDGIMVYSKVIRMSLSVAARVILAPNPVHDKLTVLFPAADHFTTISVYNIMGKKVLEKSVFSLATQAEVDVHSLSAGMYRLVLEGDKQQSISFIKQ